MSRLSLLAEDRRKRRRCDLAMEGTIAEAAKGLGITQNAVRQRIRRGSLTATKRGRRVYVAYEPTASTSADTAAKEEPRQANDLSALVKAHAEEIAHLKSQIEAKDRQLEATARHLEGALTIGMAQRALEGPSGSWWRRLVGKS